MVTVAIFSLVLRTLQTSLSSLHSCSILCSCSLHTLSLFSKRRRPIFHSLSKNHSAVRAMDSSVSAKEKGMPLGVDPTVEEEYASQSALLKEFTRISSVDKAWTFNSDTGIGTQAMFLVSQADLLANKRRRFMLSASIKKEDGKSMNFEWAPFPVEMVGVSLVIPSPSRSKLLVVRNPEGETPTRLEIWSQSELEKEFLVPQSVHGSVYTDGWFEGISWNSNEMLIAYVAEEPRPLKPAFNHEGYKKGSLNEKDCSSWKGQGEFEEDWGETYAGKRQPALFIINTSSGEVQPVKGISKSLSVGQVVWAPSAMDTQQYLVFVGWYADNRKLGIKYCYNRPCALYAVASATFKSEANDLEPKDGSNQDTSVINLTQSISSAYFPVFSPDGKFLVFLSSRCAVDSGAHCATDSLHKINWSDDVKLNPSGKIVDVVSAVQCPKNDGFPGIHWPNILRNPWLSDGCTMILVSAWGSRRVILSVNVLSGDVTRISPSDSDFSWNVLALDGDNIISVSSSPVDVPQIKYGYSGDKSTNWSWLTAWSPFFKCPDKVKSLLSSKEFSILKIPVKNIYDGLAKGAANPYEAIFVSSKRTDPLIVMLHGGPHSVSLSNFSKSIAFLSSLGFSLLMVNYRGSLGFGEEALQSLPGKIGSQDVNDVLAAIDHVIDTGLVTPSKLFVIGGSHGGFLTTHLIGQAPERFAAAAARNPVCNLSSMIATSDIPDWCYVEIFGSEWKNRYTGAPSVDDLAVFHSKSPISYISKVKAPTIFLIGAQDLRVPPSNGMQYARALKERGIDAKIIVFPNDVHGIESPQSDFESFLNIGVWFKKYC